jgi:hypothetical protein
LEHLALLIFALKNSENAGDIPKKCYMLFPCEYR